MNRNSFVRGFVRGLLVRLRNTTKSVIILCSIIAMAKLDRNEDVWAGVLEKICLALDCKMDDILDIVPNKE